MKIYLDDARKAPMGWTRTYTVDDTLHLLYSCGRLITDISLDHDLGSCTETGYDVLLWIEEQVHTNPNYKCPNILIHTSNPSARRKMELAVNSIKKFIGENINEL